jgi:hypothetical protein
MSSGFTQTKITQKGLLQGLTLDVWGAVDLAAAGKRTEIKLVSFYRQRLDGGRPGMSFRGVTFKQCGFGHSVFTNISFINCRFEEVDLTRTQFRNCLFSRCKFIKSDPYYALFPQSDIDPSSFAGIYRATGCYANSTDYNKATLLFSNLRASLSRRGDVRKAKRAEYYLRVWERKKLWIYSWKKKDHGPFVWLQSLFLGGLNGYGERPQYALVWMVFVITVFAAVYRCFFTTAITTGQGFLDDWYFSFRVFFAQAFGPQLPAPRLLLCQVVEFGFGLILVAVFIGSAARKLSA